MHIGYSGWVIWGPHTARARVLAGKMLTEVAGARRGWETAMARSSTTGVSAEAACRGRSAGVLRGRPCVYGDGDVDLG
jgi:hypothetical protein